MIMRVYRCTVIAGKEAEFRAFASSRSHPWLRQREGLVAFYAARPLPDSTDRMRCMVQIWESVAAIQAALGDDWREQPKLSVDARRCIEQASVEHYELADVFRSTATSSALPHMD